MAESKLDTIKSAVDYGKEIITDKSLQKTFLGTYSDGTPRSLPDALKGEVISPKQKEKLQKKAKNKKKKKKAKKKLEFII